MIGRWIIIALFAAGEGGTQDLFQVRFHSGGTILAQEAPVERAGRLLFRRHPDGVLISVRKSEVARAIPVRIKLARSLRVGEQLDIGFTGEGAEPKGGPPQPGIRQGEAPGGSPTGSPNWEYRSISGRRLVVGYNVPFAPAPAVQQAPGQPPTGVPSGPPPTRPN